MGARRHCYRAAQLGMASAWVLLATSAALAFDVRRDAKGALVRYPDRPIGVYVRYVGAPIGVTPSVLHKAVQGAIDAWIAAPNTKIPLAYGGLVHEAARFDISIAFDSAFEISAGEVLARTTRVRDGQAELIRTDITLNSHDVQWTPLPLAGALQVAADLQGALTHQLGHALGLDHSRSTGASLYFYDTTTNSRSLSADDIKGAQFLWPKNGKRPSDGGQCDACDGDTDCSSGQCLAWPDGNRYCAQSCTNHDDCAIGTSCGSYANNSALACLPNDGHCKADAARADLGAACASDLACEGYCMPGGDVGFCAASCTSCAAPGQCVQTNVGSLCLVRGSAGLKSPCQVPGDCNSFVCAPSIFGGGHCSAGCKAGCPAGWSCEDTGVCAPDSNPGGLAVGWPCKSGFDCATGHCLTTKGGKFERVCTQKCVIATDCPAGTGCAEQGDTDFCLPAGNAAVAGMPCPGAKSCGGTLVCDSSPVSGMGACRAPCDPYSSANSCGSGEICAWFGSQSSLGGVCKAAIGGSRPWGAQCSAADACRADLVCVADAKVSAELSVPGGVCRADCDPKTAAGCDKTETCTPLDAAGSHGVCQVGPTGPATQVQPNPDKPHNFTGRTLALPKVVRAAAWKYVPPATVAPVDQGCGAGKSGGGGMALAILALLGALACRRATRVFHPATARSPWPSSRA